MTLSELESKIETIERLVLEIHANTAKQWLSLNGVCDLYLGRSREWARQHPWALPEPDLGKNRWSREACDEFYSVPLELRREQYMAARRSA